MTVKVITSSNETERDWQIARSVPNVGRRRLANKSHRVPSSTRAFRARSRRVQPRRIRARSSASTLTDHSTSRAVTFNVDCEQWKARCYAFRAVRPSATGAPTRLPRMALGAVFGGRLLGASDRKVHILVPANRSRPLPAVTRPLGASQDPGCTTTWPRCASRTGLRARAHRCAACGP